MTKSSAGRIDPTPAPPCTPSRAPHADSTPLYAASGAPHSKMEGPAAAPKPTAGAAGGAPNGAPSGELHSKIEVDAGAAGVHGWVASAASLLLLAGLGAASLSRLSCIRCTLSLRVWSRSWKSLAESRSRPLSCSSTDDEWLACCREGWRAACATACNCASSAFNLAMSAFTMRVSWLISSVGSAKRRRVEECASSVSFPSFPAVASISAPRAEAALAKAEREEDEEGWEGRGGGWARRTARRERNSAVRSIIGPRTLA
eukprot:scaffold117738_cov35-Tisochrysis_lutea.AAC.1